MKTLILVVFVFGGASGAFHLAHQEYQIHQCQSAGFDRINRDGMCVYKSRYTNIDYITTPSRAAEYFLAVKDYEADERKHKR